LCVATVFAGKERSLEIYRRWVSRLSWHRDWCSLLAVDNSCDDAFHVALLKLMSELPFNHAVVRCDERATGHAPRDLADTLRERNANKYALSRHVARLYAIARQTMPAATDLLVTVEDDTEPPPGFDLKLVEALLRHPRAGIATGCQRSRHASDSWTIWRGGKRVPPPAPSYFANVDWTGFYCAMFRREAIDNVTFRPTLDCSPIRCAFDWAACEDVRAAGNDIVAVGDVVCKHWRGDDSFV